MIFETLHSSAQRGELLLLDGGYCRYHRRRDGITIIYEIISLRPGAGQQMLAQLQRPIVARCPADLPSNAWYLRRGFELLDVERSRRGRAINVWRLC